MVSRTRPIRRAMTTTFAMSLVLLSGALLAAAQVQGSPDDANTATGSEPAQVPYAYSSPRATMETFLTAFYREDGPDLNRAASCLDLSGLPPAVRALQGPELAGMLKRVIDRTQLVDLEAIPDDPEGGPWVFKRYDAGSIVISRSEGDRWLFTSDTVAALWGIFDEVADREVVAGIEDAHDIVTPAMWMRSVVPETFRKRLVFLEGWQWVGILIVILVGFIVARIFTALAATAVDRAIARRFQQVDKSLLTATINPASVLLMVILWGLGALWLGLPAVVLKIYVDGIVVVAVVAFSIMAYRVIDVVNAVAERRAEETESRFDDLLIPLIRKSLKVLVVAIGLVTVAG
ncbi:MAG: hypothetical protein P8Y93_09360, partial [Acidobacteriota bacterium]